MRLFVATLLACFCLTHGLPVFTSDATNVCGLNYNYCPRDPGCPTYTLSVHNVEVRDLNSTSDIKIQDVTAGSVFSVTITGKTTLTSVPAAGSYRIYALTGGNVGQGVLSDVLTLGSNSSFTMHVEFAVEQSNFGGSKDIFEFGVDVFQQASGSDEGFCIQVESDAYVAEVKAKVSPPFEFLCKDEGDGHFEKLSTPVPMPVFPITGATCGPPPPPACALDWYYCPRDPGCTTYTMSVETVEFDTHDTSGYKAGDKVTLIAKGSTTITSIPTAGSYRIYSLSGKNEATGVLSDVMTLTGSGAFTLTVPFTLTADSFDGDDFEFGLDVFQAKSGSDEGMCIEVANPHYVAEQQAKPSPKFVTYCKDEGHGHFVSTLPDGTPEVVKPVKCVL